jgi:hypothetical protein
MRAKFGVDSGKPGRKYKLMLAFKSVIDTLDK